MRSHECDPTVPCIPAFWQFVQLRMEAFELRKRGLRSPDRVLASGWFPNVKRELDRGTIYFQERIAGGTPAIVISKSVVYRLLNRRQTFESYGGIPGPAELAPYRVWVSAARARGEQLFTGRHQTIGFQRYLQALDFLDGPYSQELASVAQEVQEGSRKGAWKKLQDLVPGVAAFTGWQIICDLMETYNLDENLWAYMGPGPQGAYGMLTGTIGSQVQVLSLGRELQESSCNSYALSLKNVEHALCEYFRYTRSWWAI